MTSHRNHPAAAGFVSLQQGILYASCVSCEGYITILGQKDLWLSCAALDYHHPALAVSCTITTHGSLQHLLQSLHT